MNDVVEQILECKDLWVVLENRFGSKYVESYHLANILCSGHDFWGKFRNIHAAEGHKSISNKNTLSYAYNNFSEIVCTNCLNERLERYYSAYAYSSLDFIVKNNFKKIWNNSELGQIDDIAYAVRNGLRLKLLLESNDGYVYILPVHTLEVYEGDNTFSLATEFDGYPERLRYFQTIKLLDIDFKAQATEKSNDSPDYVFSKFNLTYFFMTYFYVIGNGDIVHRSLGADSSIVEKKFSYKKYEIWVEDL